MLMLSGPVELLFLDCLMACSVCFSVMMIFSLCRVLVCLSIFLFAFCVECVVVFVNCLLNASAMSLCVCMVLLLNVKVVFGWCCAELCFIPLIVFQRMWVLCL